MKTDDLPRYIEAPGGGMWGPMPAGFTITNKDSVFVKLKDVESLINGPVTVTVSEKVVVQDGEQFVCVGKGGRYLTDLAAEHGWELYSSSGNCGKLDYGWAGDSPSREYFIKK